MRLLIFFCAVLLFNLGFSQPVLYWSQYSNGVHSLHKGNIDGTSPSKVLSSSVFSAISYDSTQKVLYIIDEAKKEVLKFDLQSKQQSVFFPNLISPKDLYFNSTENALYLLDGNYLLKIRTNGLFDIISSNFSQTTSFIMNEANKIIYCTTSDGTVFSANYNGDNKKILVKDQKSPNEIATNKEQNKLYWKSYCGALSCSGVFSCGVDGSGLTKIVDEFVSTFFVTTNNLIFYTNTTFVGKIYYSDIDGQNEKTFYDGSTNAQSFYFSLSDSTLYFSDLQYGNALKSFKPGSLSILIPTSVYNLKNMVFDSINKKIIWINTTSSFLNDRNTSIARCNFDGSKVETLLNNSKLPKPSGIDIDETQNKMYISDTENGAIYTADIDGKNLKTILNQQKSPKQLFFDHKNKKLIWLNVGEKAIKSCDIDGKNVKTIFSDQATDFSLLSVSFDDETLYWYNPSNKTINSVKSDGTGAKEIIKISNIEYINSICYFNNRIYWSDDYSRVIKSCNLDGQDVKTIIQFPSGSYPNYINIIDQNIINKLIDIQNNQHKIEISPNPFNSYVNIKCKLDEIAYISCLDMDGRFLKSFGKININNCNLDLSDINQKTVIINILLQNGESLSYFLIKE